MIEIIESEPNSVDIKTITRIITRDVNAPSENADVKMNEKNSAFDTIVQMNQGQDEKISHNEFLGFNYYPCR